MMSRTLAVLLLVAPFAQASAAVPLVQVTGNILRPDGTGPTQGTVTCVLSQPGTVIDSDLGILQVVASEVTFTLINGGALPSTAALVPNDSIAPSGTVYACTMRVQLNGGRWATWTEHWSISGLPNPIAIGAITRVATATSGGATTVSPTSAAYDLAVFAPGQPTGGALLFEVRMARAVFVPVGCSGSTGVVGTNPTGAATVMVTRNGTTVATATISTGGAVSWSCSTSTSWAAGDILAMRYQNAGDATLADLSILYSGVRQ